MAVEAARRAPSPDSRTQFLTRMDVLKGVAQGMNSRQIRAEYQLPARTPHRTKESIRQSMGASSDEQMVAVALASNLITIDVPESFDPTTDPPQKGLAFLSELANGKTRADLATQEHMRPESISRHVEKAVRHYHANTQNTAHAIALAITNGDMTFAQHDNGSFLFSPKAPEVQPPTLSAVSKQRLILHAQGQSFEDIAETQIYAPGTIRNHFKTLHQRFGARSTSELVTQLIQQDVIPLKEIGIDTTLLPLDSLTPRQRRLLDMAAQGFTNQEIADALGVVQC